MKSMHYLNHSIYTEEKKKEKSQTQIGENRKFKAEVKTLKKAIWQIYGLHSFDKLASGLN